MLDALQKSAFAQGIAQSQAITATLSALHVLGFAMVTSGALMFGLRSLGVLFRDRPPLDVLRPATRAVMLGAAMNVMTGALMFSPRAVSALANPIFQAKMLFLISAVLVHVILMRRLVRRYHGGRAAGRIVAGAAGAVLWLAVGVAGAAFILIE
jgi:hypothetical protein